MTEFVRICQSPVDVVAAVRNWARNAPHHVALRDPAAAGGALEVTYLGLWEAVMAAAGRLAADGVQAGSRLALWLPNGVEWVITALAADYLGALIAPINVRYRATEFRAAIRSIRPDALVMADQFMTNDLVGRLDEAFPQLTQSASDDRGVGRIYLVSGSHPAADQFRPWPPQEAIPDPYDLPIPDPYDLPIPDPYDLPGRKTSVASSTSRPFICYWTSGTTADPKGVVHDRSLLANVANWTSMMAYSEKDVLVVTRPFYYIAGSCWALFGGLLHGATVVLGKYFTPNETVRLIELCGGTVMLGGIGVYDGVIKELDRTGRHDAVRTLQRGYFGGQRPPEDFTVRVRRELGIESLVQTYGMTEGQGFVTSTLPDEKPDVTQQTVGFPLDGFELELRDKRGRQLSARGAVGELWIRGRMLLGYLRNGVIEAPPVDPMGWFATGDVLWQDADDRWHYEARLRNTGKVRGELVYLDEVDAVLLGHPKVLQAGTFARHRDGSDEFVAVVLVDTDLSELERGPELLSAIVGFVRSRLSPHKVPTHLYAYPTDEEWPLTATGKLRRGVLEGVIRERSDLLSWHRA